MTLYRKRFLFVLPLLFMLSACLIQQLPDHSSDTSSVQYRKSVTQERLAQLKRGINIHEWFFCSGAVRKSRLRDVDFELIKQLGFTYVRLPVSLNYIQTDKINYTINDNRLKEVEDAVEWILSFGLSVSVDIHSISSKGTATGIYTDGIEGNPAGSRRFIRLWDKLAERLSVFDPERFFIELMNEPCYRGRYDEWYTLQKKLVDVVRARAPRHTIIATSPYWSNSSTLLNMEPLVDPNIVYTFHFYEPVLFVNQGITWGMPLFKELRGLHYPSSPQRVLKSVRDMSNPLLAAWITLYGNERWDSQDLEDIMGRTAAWAKKNKVPVICNEFGAYCRFTPREDRISWYTDVRRAFEKFDIGWAVWDYDSKNSFGLVQRIGKTLKVDNELARALGLNGYPSMPVETPMITSSEDFSVAEVVDDAEDSSPHAVSIGEFSFQSPSGFSLTTGSDYALLLRKDEQMCVFLFGVQGRLFQTNKATLKYIIDVFDDLEGAEVGPIHKVTASGYRGLARDFQGRLSKTFLNGQISVIHHRKIFFIAMGFSMDRTGKPEWDKQKSEIFDNLLDSVEL